MIQAVAINSEDVQPGDTGAREVSSRTAWDAFLETNPQGQFQQSSAWGEFKSSEGWTCRRIVLSGADGLLGGCQVLMRSHRLGRIGYISKGPVLREETPACAGLFWNRLREFVKREKLSALLIHPPDRSQHWVEVLHSVGCLSCFDLGVITSTIRVDLTGGPAAVESRYSRTTRRTIRLATECGVKIRSADESDAAIFFNLVEQTCARQQVQPNPGSSDSVRRMHRALAARNAARLTLAELNGTPIAGLFCVPFGRTLSIWKKGSSSVAADCHAVDLLYHAALSWGSLAGYSDADFVGISRDTAETMLSGQEFSEAQKRSRDFFNIRFGGRPALLPPPCIFVPNPALRFCLKLSLALAPVRKRLRQAVH